MEPTEPPGRPGASAEEDPRPDRRTRLRATALRVARGAPGSLAVLARGVLRWALRLALPLAGAAALLHALPYHASVQGVQFRVEGSLLTRPGLSANTTLGSWQFPDLDGLPIGVHVTPENVDLLQLTRGARGNPADFVHRLQADFTAQAPRILTWLLAEVLLGLALGLLAAAAVNMSVRYLRGHPRRPQELRLRLLQLGGAVGAVVLVAGYGVLTYNPHWVQRSQLTGTLAAAQLFPDQLSRYYASQNKAFDVLGSVLGIQAALQQQIETDQTPQTALRIMFISDMHLAATYPLVQVYARSYDVNLIVNTGDDSMFGTRMELTPGYIDAVRAVAAQTPMLWLAGNHDSPDVERTMRSVPGVTVLGSKTRVDDGYQVRGGVVDAFGLTVAGIPDPRVYGGPGAYGFDDPARTDPLERDAVDTAIAGVRGAGATAVEDGPAGDGRSFDIFATHEPVAAAELRRQLPDRIRQTNAGHVHRQNDSAQLQDGSGIDLVEGSTGAGGLSDIVRGEDRPPIEFSIESVAPDCQFTRVVRFRVRSSTPTGSEQAGAATPPAFGDDVTASTIYFRPQQIAEGRTCDAARGIGPERPL
jgi:predicted MPP superfamily phosphohydrolase